MKTALAIAFLALACFCAHAQTAQVQPANPVAGEDFVITITTPPFCRQPSFTTVTYSFQTVAVTTRFDEDSSCAGIPARSQVVIVTANVASAGTYAVNYQRTTATTLTPISTIATFQVGPANPGVPPQHRGLTGLWWNPAEPGRGLNVTQGDSGLLFLFWYTYLEDRSAIWLNMSNGRWISPTEFRGVLYATKTFGGGQAPYAAASVSVLSPDRLEFRYGNVAPQILERFRF